MALAVKYNLDIEQMDAVTAFLQGELKEDVYIEKPEGFKDDSGKVFKLHKALYGLKQASLVWNRKLDAALKTYNLTRSKVDPCIYFNIKPTNMTILAIYVDDILIFSNDTMFRENLKKKLSSQFKMKILGKAKQCLGLKITRENGNIYLDQEKYILDILDRFNMNECNPVSTPLDINQKLNKDLSPKSIKEEHEMRKVPYQQAIGSLLFAANLTRPDISQAVNHLSKFNNNPGIQHWNAVKRIFRYLKGSASARLGFYRDGNTDMLAYSDSDWASDSDERRSTTGYVVVMQGGAVSWNSRRQQTIALSTCEAEYMALSAATQEVLWLRELNAELNPGFKSNEATTIFCDNRSAVHLATTSSYHPKSKHIEIRHHFIREKFELGAIKFENIGTDDMIADNLTKAVVKPKHQFCCKEMGLMI